MRKTLSNLIRETVRQEINLLKKELKENLKNFATKEDLKVFAMKEDFFEFQKSC